MIGPAPFRDVVALVAAVSVGFLFAWWFAWTEWGPCSPALQTFDAPLKALLGIPLQDAPVPPGYIVLHDGACRPDYMPPMLRIWLLLWLPLLLCAAAAGYLAAYWAASISLTRSAVAGAVPLLLIFLQRAHGGPSYELGPFSLARVVGIILIAGCLGAAMGLLGGKLAAKHSEARQPRRPFGGVQDFSRTEMRDD
jgi:hypothetical protein